MNDDLQLEAQTYTEYLLTDGNVVEGEFELKEPKIAAKIIHSLESGRLRYYIKSAKGFLYNPLSPKHNVPNGRLDLRWTWKSVNEETMKFYVQFIETKNEVHYKHAERTKID